MPRRRPVSAVVPPVAERTFQAQVEQYARLMGWLFFHTRYSMKSVAGFPDLVLLRGDRMVVAELKTVVGKTSKAQDEWLAAFLRIPGVRVFIWRPDDASWAQIEQVLGRAA